MKPETSFGLSGFLAQSRISLPLKGVEAEFSVRGDLVSVELRQIYHQNQREPLDVRYTFPVPDGAAVYCCEMIVNDRVIAATVMKAEEARALAEARKSEGHRVALMESVRGNLFELALGNLAPGDTVVIRLCWFQVTDHAGAERSFRIPFTPGVRYIPGSPLLRRNGGAGTELDTDQVPDASRISPPRIDDLHPDAAWVSIKGRIALEGVNANGVGSPSHTLVIRDTDEELHVRLGDASSVPDRDFVLRIPPASPDALLQIADVVEIAGERHALVRIVAPRIAPASLLARDVYFLVDRSGSMQGEKWVATCAAFRAFLTNLAPQDRAWVTFFSTGQRDLAEKPLPPAAILAQPVVQELEKWAPDGGTELLPALHHVLQALGQHSAARHPVIVLITDGQVGNEARIIDSLAEHRGVPVYCYGIDHAVNDGLLQRLAARHGGACVLATPRQDLVGSIASLAARLRHPVLTSIEPPEGWELPGDSIPDLHAGEFLSLSFRWAGAGAPDNMLTFPACGSSGERVLLNCPVRITHDPAIARLWQKEKIRHLLESNLHVEAVALSIRANVVCTGTSFVAWDPVERIAITEAPREIYQPSLRKHMHRRAVDSSFSCDLAGPDEFDLPLLRLMECGLEAPDGDWRCLFKGTMPSQSVRTPIADPSPLIDLHIGDTDWRAAFALIRNLTIPAPVLDWLEHWALSDPSETRNRCAELKKLAISLSTHKAPREALCQWIQDHLPEAFRIPALRLLQ